MSIGETGRRMTRRNVGFASTWIVLSPSTITLAVSMSIRGNAAPMPAENTNIGSLAFICRRAGLVQKEEEEVVGRALDLKSTMLGLAFMSMLLLLLVERGCGDTAVDKWRNKRIASLNILLQNLNLISSF